jgi:glycine cleavage system H protein
LPTEGLDCGIDAAKYNQGPIVAESFPPGIRRSSESNPAFSSNRTWASQERFPGLMPIDPARTQYYRRARFTTRLPTHYVYSRSHFWLLETEPGNWRVGLTHFATRMLGDFVECEFQVGPDEHVTLGQTIGWVEGFKAIADIFCVVDGTFVGFNSELNTKPELIDKDAYDRGWLFQVRGKPDPTCVDCAGYIELLDRAVDRILSQQGEGDVTDRSDLESDSEPSTWEDSRENRKC